MPIYVFVQLTWEIRHLTQQNLVLHAKWTKPCREYLILYTTAVILGALKRNKKAFFTNLITSDFWLTENGKRKG